MAFVDMEIDPPPESTEIIHEDSDTIVFEIKKNSTKTFDYFVENNAQTTNEWNSIKTESPITTFRTSTNISNLRGYLGPEDDRTIHLEPFTKGYEENEGVSTVTQAIQTVSGYLNEEHPRTTETTTKIHERFETNFTRSTNSFTNFLENLSLQEENATESFLQVFNETTEDNIADELIIDRVSSSIKDNFGTNFTQSTNSFTNFLENLSLQKVNATESFLQVFNETTEDKIADELIIDRVSSSIKDNFGTNFTQSTNSFTNFLENLSSQKENVTKSFLQVFNETTEDKIADELIIDRVSSSIKDNFEPNFTQSILKTFSSPKEESFLNVFNTTEDRPEEDLIITRISSRFGDLAPTNMEKTSEMIDDYTTNIPLEKTTINDVSERVTEKLYLQYDNWIFYLIAVFVFAIIIVSTLVIVYMRSRKRSYGVSLRMSDFTSSSSVV